MSYLNFYIANGGVVMPAFGDAMDQPARDCVAEAYPDRRVVQVDAIDIVINAPEDESAIEKAAAIVEEITKAFPLPY